MNSIKAICAVVAVILFCCVSRGFAQGSSQGKEFWTGYMMHIAAPTKNGDGSKMSLYITGDVATEGQIEIADKSFSTTFNVRPNRVTIVDIPASAFLVNQGQFLKGIHITAAKNIAVYAHIYYRSVSGATLLLPVNVMGKSYYSINYTQSANQRGYSTFMVIATEDNTTVEIIPSKALNDQTVPESFTVKLQKGEIYQGTSDFDLTNTVIRSISTQTGECKKIAVFSGSSKIGIGCAEQPVKEPFSSDNLFQQVFPTSSWGKNYITIPLAKRNYDVYRVIFSNPSTKLTINGQKVNFTYPDPYEFESSVPNVISADQPVQVVQYAVTQGEVRGDCVYDVNDLGDPEMIYLTPLEQTLDHVTLYSAPYANIVNSYINVVMKADAASTFTLDGTPVPGFTAVPGNEAYAYKQISVTNGAHTISAGDGFNAIAYGFGESESYGYAAGANLKNLNQYITLGDKSGTKSYVKGCVGIEYKLQLVLPYQTTNIKWSLPGLPDPVTDNSPQVKATSQKDGKTLYTYEYKSLIKFDIGDYHITATVLNPVADECGSTTDIDFDFNIIDYPKTNLSVKAACAGESSVFNDATDVNGSMVKTWLWDFGDGQTSTLQNPTHVYETGADYTVTLTTTNENDCSDTKSIKITIDKKPVAAFILSTPACLSGVVFTDQSKIETGNISQWKWDFGDGSDPEIHTDKSPVTHIYKLAGTYTVSLTVANSSGCESIVYTQQVTVNPSPDPDFTLPDICLEDGTAHFTNKTSISDHTESSLTYLWNFGDANATAANPNTYKQPNPGHKYSAVGNYTITLTSISANGCSATKTATLTVNGDIPQARFTVHNNANLCSANPVVFTDLSQPTFGNVTRVEWFFDYANHPTESVVFTRDNMPADRTFMHDYGLFNSPAIKKYTVRLVAYSGETCSAITSTEIEVHANPMVEVTKIGSICYGADPKQITTDTKGYAGSGVFSGRGVTSSGIFNPAVAGTGNTTITYTFTAQSGCSYVTTQEIVVNADPVVDAGKNFTILEDDKSTLKARASEGTYKWAPAAGLDRDDVLNPVAAPTETTKYTLTVTNADGCSKADDVLITVLKKPVIVNAFTPNGDGVNDTWAIKYLNTYPGNTVDVYNRYGEKVYSSVGYGIAWDGTFKGKSLPAGAYYYIINPKNGRKTISGNVTIIR